MKTRAAVIVAVVVAAGCGRIAFDPIGTSQSDAPHLDVVTGDIATTAIPPGAGIWLEMNTDPVGGIVDSAGGHSSGCAGPCPVLGSGLHGNGYVFSGQEIEVVYASDLDASTGFTGALWLRMDQLPAGADDPACFWTMSFNPASGFDTFALCLDNAGDTLFSGETPAGVAVDDIGPTIALGAWHHMAVTWDGTRRRSYLDGIEVANKVTPIGTGTSNPQLGASRGLFHLHGVLDDAVYYARALTAGEVVQLATP